uniref:UPAR/Ly6 domain-containing protein n=1 Tax=Panagrolaimus sp. PS1159 TaxID=55785 RepID=A0AC35EXI3_9BILA
MKAAFILFIFFICFFGTINAIKCVISTTNDPISTEQDCGDGVNFCYTMIEKADALNFDITVRSCAASTSNFKHLGLKHCNDYGTGIQEINVGRITGSYYCCNTDLCNSKDFSIEKASLENSYNSATRLDTFSITITSFCLYSIFKFIYLNR